MKKDKNKHRLYVDMDGTLAVFKKVDTLEKLYEKGYFENLEPFEKVVNAIKIIKQERPEIDVHILSSVLTDSKYALKEKNAWLDRYLPEIDEEHRKFVPCGSDKKEHIKDLSPEDSLLDDYTNNLLSWEPPAKGIKLLNNINHTRGTWTSDRVRFDRDPDELAEQICNIVEGIENVYDISPQQEAYFVENGTLRRNSVIITGADADVDKSIKNSNYWETSKVNAERGSER